MEGRLWVAERDNHRVLRFYNAASKAIGADADGVLGQSDFVTGSSGLSANKMAEPFGVFVDPGGRLWVSEDVNCRVLRSDNAASKANGANADGVLGQPDYRTNTNSTTQNGTGNVRGVWLDGQGRLYAVDEGNSRILVFNNAASLPDGAPADNVIGQADFTSGSAPSPPTNSSFAYPNSMYLQKVRPQTLRSFFFKHNCRRPQTLQARLEAIRAAQPLTTDSAIIEPARLFVLALVGMLRPLHQSIAQIDREIEQAMDQHPDAPIFRSFPGAGPALAPRLLVAFGTDRQRFASAQDVAQFYGLAPVVIQSGNSKTVHMRHRCPKFGRQTFHENAAGARFHEAWAGLYYEQHRKRNEDKHHEACRALAFKLIRIQFACWRHRTPYDPDRYLQALHKHASPLHRQLHAHPNPCA